MTIKIMLLDMSQS